MKRRIISWGMTLLLLSALVVMLSFGMRRQQERKVSDVKINIRYSGAEPLISIGLLRSRINAGFGQLTGLPVNMIDVEAIQKELESISAVKSAGVQVRPDGSVEIRVIQRKPLIQVLNQAQSHYYIADDGTLIWQVSSTPASLPIISGYVVEGIAESRLNGLRCDTLKTNHVLRQAYAFGRAFEANTFMQSITEQVFLNDEGYYELVPLLGPPLILLGKADNIEIKFRNIEAFFKNTYGHIDWNKYSMMDARYDNQVICIRKTP
jgi:cell division protein FtsQ